MKNCHHLSVATLHHLKESLRQSKETGSFWNNQNIIVKNKLNIRNLLLFLLITVVNIRNSTKFNLNVSNFNNLCKKFVKIVCF